MPSPTMGYEHLSRLVGHRHLSWLVARRSIGGVGIQEREDAPGPPGWISDFKMTMSTEARDSLWSFLYSRRNDAAKEAFPLGYMFPSLGTCPTISPRLRFTFLIDLELESDLEELI